MQFLRTLYYALTPRQRRLARRIFYVFPDLADQVFRRRPPLVPPRGKIFTGRGDFIAAGNAFLDLFVTRCGLQPHHHILDVGCGIGRMARPLTGFLDKTGRYEGFDIVGEGIRWCRKHYAAYPNFAFSHVPLQNDLYNAATRNDAASFRFPYGDNAFDLVILVSVFTHMQPPEVQNYLREIHRVLKPGGHSLATFFVFDDDLAERYAKTASAFFPHRHGNYWLHDARVKNANIAFRSDYLDGMIREAGMVAVRKEAGWWPGRDKEACADFQDIVCMLRE